MASSLKLGTVSEVNPLDLHIGDKLRVRRSQLGLTQNNLAKLLGLTFQQVQKYEHGTNRLSASRLFETAHALKVPVTYFFEDAPVIKTPSFAGMSESEQDAIEDAPEEQELDFGSKETIELVRAYYKVQDSNKRKKILDLIRVMSGEI